MHEALDLNLSLGGQGEEEKAGSSGCSSSTEETRTGLSRAGSQPRLPKLLLQNKKDSPLSVVLLIHVCQKSEGSLSKVWWGLWLFLPSLGVQPGALLMLDKCSTTEPLHNLIKVCEGPGRICCVVGRRLNTAFLSSA